MFDWWQRGQCRQRSNLFMPFESDKLPLKIEQLELASREKTGKLISVSVHFTGTTAWRGFAMKYITKTRTNFRRWDLKVLLWICLLYASLDQALGQVSETAAKSSETAAKSSETAAKSSETAAKSSETAAKSSETAAKSSETAAKSSETAAKSSETAAKSSETAAKSSETAAKSSETAAKSSETAAKSSETAAKSSETAESAELEEEKIEETNPFAILYKNNIFRPKPEALSSKAGNA